MVFTARYNGTYEGAPWIAVNLHADPRMSNRELRGSQGDDIECMEWFTDSDRVIGRGDTPDQAVADLARQLDIRWKPGDDSMMAQFARAVEDAKKQKENEA